MSRLVRTENFVPFNRFIWDEMSVKGKIVPCKTFLRDDLFGTGICEWDVGREPDRDEQSEPPTAAPQPGAIQTMKTTMPNLQTIIKTFRLSAWRDGATPLIIMHSFAGCYKNACGLLTKNSL